jgi:hypothetical protein
MGGKRRLGHSQCCCCAGAHWFCLSGHADPVRLPAAPLVWEPQEAEQEGPAEEALRRAAGLAHARVKYSERKVAPEAVPRRPDAPDHCLAWEVEALWDDKVAACLSCPIFCLSVCLACPAPLSVCPALSN